MEPTNLYIPSKYVQQAAPFALDIGGSLIKIAYRPLKQNVETEPSGKDTDASSSPVCITSIPVSQASSLVDFLRTHADMAGRTEGQPITINTTGVGIQRIQGAIEETFNAKFHNLVEFDCSIGAFMHLQKSLPAVEMFYGIEEELVRPPAADALAFIKYSISVNAKQEMERMDKNTQPPKEAAAALMSLDVAETPVPVLNEVLGLGLTPPPNIFPAMLVGAGSGMWFSRVSSDGLFQLSTLSNRGGRMFLGLGRILTGAKSFEELISLAEHGDSKKVHTVFGDLQDSAGHEESEFYSNIPTDFVFYCFGKALNLDAASFSREDLAAGLLSVLMMDIVQSAIGAAFTEGCSCVIMCGSFVENPYVRQLMMQRFIFVNTMAKEKLKMPFLFVKHGSHLGALGAFMDVAGLDKE